jgi:CPA2 family monovalent cation:H+ antiporter-2
MGINIAFIKRGEIMIKIPTKMSLFPGDEICVIADAQGKEFKNYLLRNEIEIPKICREAEIFYNN